MKSLSYLNNYCSTFEITYLDARDASIIFDKNAANDQVIVVNEGKDHIIPLGIDIVDIIQGETLNIEWTIDLTNLSDPDVVWTVPVGCSVVHTPGTKIWKLSGITTKEQWEIAKYPTIVSRYSGFGEFVYDANITYTPTGSKSWHVNLTLQEGLFLNVDTTLTSDAALRKSSPIPLDTTVVLTANGKYVLRGGAALSIDNSIYAKWTPIEKGNASLLVDSLISSSYTPVKRSTSNLLSVDSTISISAKLATRGQFILSVDSTIEANPLKRFGGIYNLAVDSLITVNNNGIFSASSSLPTTVDISNIGDKLSVISSILAETSIYNNSSNTYTLYSSAFVKITSDFTSETATITITPDNLSKSIITGFTSVGYTSGVSMDPITKVVTIVNTISYANNVLNVFKYVYDSQYYGYKYNVSISGTPTNYPGGVKTASITKYIASTTYLTQPSVDTLNANNGTSLALSGYPTINYTSANNVLKIYPLNTAALTIISHDAREYTQASTFNTPLKAFVNLNALTKDGTRLAINTGAVLYVYVRSGTSWSLEQQKTLPYSTAWVVFINDAGNRIVLVYTNRLLTYTRSGTTWSNVGDYSAGYSFGTSYNHTSMSADGSIIISCNPSSQFINVFSATATSYSFSHTMSAGSNVNKVVQCRGNNNLRAVSIQGSLGKDLRIYNDTTLQQEIQVYDTSTPTLVDFNYDGSRLVCSAYRGDGANKCEIRIYKYGTSYTLEQAIQLPAMGDTINKLFFTSDGSKFIAHLTKSGVNTIEVYDSTETGGVKTYFYSETFANVDDLNVCTDSNFAISSIQETTYNTINYYSYINGTTSYDIGTKTLTLSSANKTYINNALATITLGINNTFNNDTSLIYRYEANSTGTLTFTRNQTLTGL